jgi:hypothetical protein
VRAAAAAALLLVSACQSLEATPPPQSKSVTVGDTTIRTSGSVRMDFVYVN